MKKVLCEKCICWEEIDGSAPATIDGLREKVRTPENLREREGYCRFWPPAASAFPTTEDSKRVRFPRTKPTDFCFQGEENPA